MSSRAAGLARPVDPVAAALLAAALALGAATRAYNLASPFGADFDGWLAAMYGAAGRNFAREGFVALRFAPHIANGPVRFGDVDPFVHHPPFLSIVLGLSFRAFGVSEWAARLPSALAYLGGIVAFFLLVRRLCGARVAALAAFALAALPMTGIFGGLVNFEPFVLLAQCATCAAYFRWRETGRGRDLALACALMAAAVFADWFGIFASVPIGLHALLARPRAPLGGLVAMGLAAAGALAAIFAHYAAVWPGAICELSRAFVHRAQSDVLHDYTHETYGAAQWLGRHAEFAALLFRPAGLLLCAAGAALAARSSRGELRRAAACVPLLLLMGAAPCLVFRQASYQHSFLMFQMCGGIALGVALFAAVAWTAGSARARAARALGRGAGVAAVAWLLWDAQPFTWRALAAAHDQRAYRQIGRAIAALVPFRHGVATPGPLWEGWQTIGFYADRAIQPGVASLDALESALRRPPFPSAPIRHVAILPDHAGPHEPFLRALAARYRARQLGDVVVFDIDTEPGEK